MRPVLVIIAYVFVDQSLEMAFVESDDMIQQILSATLHPALCDSILPGALEGCLDRVDLHGSNGRQDLQPILLVPIQDQIFVGWPKGESFSQLLDDPWGGWVRSDVDVQDSATVMTDDEEAVQQAESDGWHSEEIHGCDGLVVISEEG